MDTVGCRVGVSLCHQGAVIVDRHHPVGEDVTLAARVVEGDDLSNCVFDDRVRRGEHDVAGADARLHRPGDDDVGVPSEKDGYQGDGHACRQEPQPCPSQDAGSESHPRVGLGNVDLASDRVGDRGHVVALLASSERRRPRPRVSGAGAGSIRSVACRDQLISQFRLATAEELWTVLSAALLIVHPIR